MRAGGDGPHGEPGRALENLPNSLHLVLQSPELTSSKPGERLDGHLNLPAGATLVPDTSDDAVDEQDRIVAGLAGGREGARCGLAREESGSRVAADGVRVEVGQQQNAALSALFRRHFHVPASQPSERAVEVDLGQRPTVALELLRRPRRRGTDPLREVLGVAGPYAYK